MNMKLMHIFEDIADDSAYKKWKRDNVTYRGVSSGAGVRSAILGKGLYTAPASNKSFAKSYGTLMMVVGGVPEKPKVFNTLNDWEIFFYNKLVYPYSEKKGNDFPDKRDFEAETTIEDEMQRLGYDGVIIKGREMVKYDAKDVKMFKTENELRSYYDAVVAKSQGQYKK